MSRSLTAAYNREAMAYAKARVARFGRPIEHPVGAGNSAVVVDLPRCGPILIRRVPNLVPIRGVTGSADCALRPLEGP